MKTLSKMKTVVVGLGLLIIGVAIIAYSKSRVAVGAINYNLSHFVVAFGVVVVLCGVGLLISSFLRKPIGKRS